MAKPSALTAGMMKPSNLMFKPSYVTVDMTKPSLMIEVMAKPSYVTVCDGRYDQTILDDRRAGETTLSDNMG